jgi:hypothetical protein
MSTPAELASEPQAPIALTIFNRPEQTLQVFAEIRKARPKQLFLIADAGWTVVVVEARCKAARLAVEELIDWDCTVYKNYAEKNLGAKVRLATGITWVFEHVDRAIILEHDCLPHPDFFRFCTELLERYKDDERIMHISGNFFQQHNKDFKSTESYYFSQIPHIWGFATWARAWQYYDVHLSEWPQAEKEHWLEKVLTDPAVRDRWTYRFRQYYAGEIESWDGQWAFACFIHNGLCINPTRNLVSNIGFDAEALTTKDPNHQFANMPVHALDWPLVHPTAFIPNAQADAYTFKYNFDINRTWQDQFRWFVKSHFPTAYGVLRRIGR